MSGRVYDLSLTEDELAAVLEALRLCAAAQAKKSHDVVYLYRIHKTLCRQRDRQQQEARP